jgi:hypothetical protein
MENAVTGGNTPVQCEWNGFCEEYDPIYGQKTVSVYTQCYDGQWHISVAAIVSLIGSGSGTANLTVDEDGHLTGTATVTVDFYGYPPEGGEVFAWSCQASLTFGAPE